MNGKVPVQRDDITQIKTDLAYLRGVMDEMHGTLARYYEDHENMERRVVKLEIGQGELKKQTGILSMIAASIGIIAAAIAGLLGK